MKNLFKLPNRQKRTRRGATAVEFACVAPAFMIMLVVCVEFSRLSILRNVSQNACYEAARLCIAEGAQIQDGLDQAQFVLRRMGRVYSNVIINGSEYQGRVGAMDDITTGDEIDFETDEISVRIEIPLANNTFILPSSFFGQEMIVSQVTMNTERYRGFFDAAEVE